MTRVSRLVLLLSLFASSACKPESARRADKAAEQVTEAREELTREHVELGTEGANDLVARTGELAAATRTFEQRKKLRIEIVRTEHEVIATQPMLIGAMATNFPLTDVGRADVNEKLTTFHSRLEEAANTIQGLQSSDAATWIERNEDVIEAMKRLENARAAAWEALDDAPKAQRTRS